MHDPWFYCPGLQAGRVALEDAEARHALQTLRLRAGAAITLFDGCGRIARAAVLEQDDAVRPGPQTAARRRQARGAVVHVERVQQIEPASSTLTLVLAPCKGERLDWAIEKCTELGVGRIVLAHFERSVVRAGPQHLARLQRTAVAACKQCRRAWLPHFAAGVSLEDLLAAETPAALLAAHPADEAPGFAEWLATQWPIFGELIVVIGPEGGLSDGELQRIAAAGGKPVRLARNILRVETAVLSVAAVWAAREISG